jgi:hypothetical protein
VDVYSAGEGHVGCGMGWLCEEDNCRCVKGDAGRESSRQVHSVGSGHNGSVQGLT